MAELSAQEEAGFIEAMKAIKSEGKSQHEANQEVLAQVKSMLSPEDFKDLKAELSDSGYVYDFKFVTAAKGQSWESDYKYQHGRRIVNETLFGGMSGDESAGDVYIPVLDDRWFKFSYSM